MSRVRTVTVGFLCFILVAAGASAAFQRPIRVAYHKWRLQAAKSESARLKNQGPSRIEELGALFRGKPLTSVEYSIIAESHAQSLVQLGFLQRADYRIEAEDITAIDELMRALEAMKTKCPWWTYTIPKGATNVVVIGCPKGMAQWQKKVEGLPLCVGDCCPKHNVLAARTPARPDFF
jgi:hypothetical protein